jgi:hypothetical protein
MKTQKAASKATTKAKENARPKPPGIGRSAITGRFMSVASAKAHKKTAIVMGGRPKKKED